MPTECEAEEMVLIPESKNAVPALVDGSVPRPRLLATLDGDGRVTLVCAPSGCNAARASRTSWWAPMESPPTRRECRSSTTAR